MMLSARAAPRRCDRRRVQAAPVFVRLGFGDGGVSLRVEPPEGVDAVHELSKGWTVFRSRLIRRADKHPQERFCRRVLGLVVDKRQQPRAVRDVVDMRLFRQKRTRPVAALAARLGRRARPRLARRRVVVVLRERRRVGAAGVLPVRARAVGVARASVICVYLQAPSRS